MQISAAHTSWTLSGPFDDLASYAGAEPIEDRDCLVLRPTSSKAYEAASAPWPVVAGHAYRMTAPISPAMDGAHAQCFLAWLGSDGDEIARVEGPITFMEHAFADESTWGLAPDGATAARLVIRLTSDEQTWKKAVGSVRIGAPRLEPSLVATLTAQADAGLYNPQEPANHTLTIDGAPDTLRRVTARYAVYDYDRQVAAEGMAEVSLAAGAGETVLALPGQPSGYYRVELSAVAEGLAPAETWASYACIPPLEQTPPEDTPIALDAGISWRYEREYEGAQRSHEERTRIKREASARIGLRCLRDRWSWSQTNPEPGVVGWGPYAVTHQAQADAGISVYQMIAGTPEWALVDTPAVAHRHSFPPADVRAYYLHIRQLIRDWGHAVRYFESWNEPEIFFFQGYAWDLAALSKAAYLACKDEDPSVGVLWASRCAATTFWRRALENGCAPYFDIFNQHSYDAPETVFELTRQDRELMAEFGIQRPVWMSEQGCRTDPDPDGGYVHAERSEVSYLLRSYACGLGAGYDRFFYFYLQEFLEWGQWLWGIMRDDQTPKPALMALATLVRQLGDAEPVGYLQQDRAYAVVFDRGDGEHVAVAWALDGNAVGLSLHEGAHIVDAMGRRVRDLPAGDVRLQVNDQPLFVRGVDPDAMALRPTPPRPRYAPDPTPPTEAMHVWLQAVARPDQPYPDSAGMTRDKLALGVAPGDTETIAWRVHNYGETTAEVGVEVDLPDGWELVSLDRAALTVAAGAYEDAVATVTVGPIEEDMDASVGATLLLDGTPNDVARIYYRLAYPLDVPEGARWSAHTALGDLLANAEARAVLAKHLPPTLLHDPRLSEPRVQAVPLANVARWAGGLVTQEALRAIHEELVRL